MFRLVFFLFLQFLNASQLRYIFIYYIIYYFMWSEMELFKIQLMKTLETFVCS